MFASTPSVNRSSSAARPGFRVAAPLAILALLLVGGLAWAHDDDDDDHPPSGPPPQQQPNVPDADGDGLPLWQEMLLGTSPTCADSDYDGVSDLEEMARRSSPLSSMSTPDLTKRLGVGVMVHAQTDGLHGLVSVFMSDTDLRTKQLKVGFVGPDRYIELSNTFLAQNATVLYFPSVTTSGCIALLDIRFPANMVHSLGEMTLFARASLPGLPGSIADGAHMRSIAGLVVWAMPAPAPILQHAGCSPSSGGTPAGGSIYVPLLPSNPISGGGTTTGGGGTGGGSGGGSSTIPITWAAGEVCFQRSTPIGVNGSTITNEIVSAECVDDWEGFCPPSCSQSVGTTYRTVDPLVLIGG